VLLNPVHPQQDSIVELQRFEIVIDERLR